MAVQPCSKMGYGRVVGRATTSALHWNFHSDAALTVEGAIAVRRDPVQEWREQYARCCHHLDFEPLPVKPFHHAVKPIFDEPRIVRTTLSPGFIFRDEDLVRDCDDSVSLVIASSRKLNILHRGHEVQLAPGEATIMQADAPGRCGSREGFVVSEIMVSPAEWVARGAHPGDALMQHIRRNSDALKLLGSYTRSLEKTTLASSAQGREIVCRHIIDLVVLAATPHPSIGESNASAVVAARLHTIFHYIAAHFSDPELSLSNVARSLHISPRYLQRLMETSGTSFTGYVNGLRLERAFMLLAARCEVRVSDVALQVGFSDISHFNRLFRSRFGGTPRDVRAQARRSGSIA
jgi:AraC-like DNA-binding protein